MLDSSFASRGDLHSVGPVVLCGKRHTSGCLEAPLCARRLSVCSFVGESDRHDGRL